MEFKHLPVMLNECIQALNIQESGTYVDGTTGGAGHSGQILKHLGAHGRLICIDKDKEALTHAREILDNDCRVIFVHDDYKNISNILKELNVDYVDGILLDLGVSSYQLDNRERGFSYMGENNLDMRMNSEQSLSAKDIVNEYSYERLIKIFYEYGEERYSSKIANRIIANRPINTTKQLADIIESCYPVKERFKGGSPNKRVFQAIRIEVNEELDGLGNAITTMTRRLNIGGRIAIITFHSLEDRIVKTVFNELRSECVCPPHMPICRCGKIKEIELINRKPLVATQEELDLNSRSHSAKLRIAERIVR